MRSKIAAMCSSGDSSGLANGCSRISFVAIALACALVVSTSSSYAQSESVIYNFDCYHAPQNGCGPGGNLVEKDGVLFGVNSSGVYALKPPATPGGQWSETVLNSSTSVTHGFIMSTNHTLYGTTGDSGTYGAGTVYSLVPPPNGGTPWIVTTLYNFGGNNSNIWNPNSALIADSSGTLYGTAYIGDAPCSSNGVDYACGGVFSLSPPSAPGGAWTERSLYSFRYPITNAIVPQGPLLLGQNGVLYGTAGGGAYVKGAIYSLTPPRAAGGAWTEQIIYSFTGELDGSGPAGPLIADRSGRLFGTCADGGEPPGFGTAFELTPPSSPGGSWTEHTIWVFGVNAGDGGAGGFGLTQGNGVLYGVTGFNYAPNEVVFQLTPPSVLGNPWTETILHTFGVTIDDGAYPSSGLLLTQSGTLYGTTLYGGTGAYGDGTVYEVTP